MAGTSRSPNGLFQAVAAKAAGGYGRILFTTSVAGYFVGGSEPGSAFYHTYLSGKRALLADGNTSRAITEAAGLGVGVSTVNPVAINTALAEGLNPIFLQPVDGSGNSIGDPVFQDFLDLVRDFLANGVPVGLAGEGYRQLLEMADPDPNIVIGGADGAPAIQGATSCC